MSEAEIQNLILDFLNRNRIFAFRVNTTGIFDPVKKIYRTMGKFSLKGVSDIIGILPNGRFLAIEVKSSTGRVSTEQQAFINKIMAMGGVALVARSLEDVIIPINGLRRQKWIG